jgi:hypothetical protein
MEGLTSHVGTELQEFNVFGQKWIVMSQAYFVPATADVLSSVTV